jgi:hypothetical protein
MKTWWNAPCTKRWHYWPQQAVPIHCENFGFDSILVALLDEFSLKKNTVEHNLIKNENCNSRLFVAVNFLTCEMDACEFLMRWPSSQMTRSGPGLTSSCWISGKYKYKFASSPEFEFFVECAVVKHPDWVQVTKLIVWTNLSQWMYFNCGHGFYAWQQETRHAEGKRCQDLLKRWNCLDVKFLKETWRPYSTKNVSYV